MSSPNPSPETTQNRRRHVVAVPYPGRGHINPMLHLCNLLISKSPDLLITIIVTQEWHTLLLAADSAFDDNTNVRLASIPNVIPSERIRGSVFPAFYDAVVTKMEAPVDELIGRMSSDGLPAVSAVISDYELNWAIGIGRRRGIPVAMFCTVPARVYFLFHRFARVQDLKLRDHLLDHGDNHSEYSNHGISPPDVEDLQAIFQGDDRVIMNQSLECRSWIPKAEYLLINTVHDLESETIKSLTPEFDSSIYPIGPCIPFSQINKPITPINEPESPHFKFLDSHSVSSVLYICLGSSLSISRDQMDEMAAGLRDSCVPFLWVARGESERVRVFCREKGMVVPWCDQLKVLSHGSVGGFWTHCGWNSTLESVYCGVPMLTFPLIFDQTPNERMLVEKWRIGWRLKGDGGEELVRRDVICEVVKRFMNGEDSEVKELRKRGEELREVCRAAIGDGGSSCKNLDEFIDGISGSC
ncbi:UDP-glycosyltransferase 87A2 [Linum perenne]